MSKWKHRIKKYNLISTELACLSNDHLIQILADAKSMHKGIGGTSSLIYINETPVFVKKVPLTDLEMQPQNFMSTANIFNLPLYYQYGVGSAGFGAWRELAAHIMTTNWVIAEECPNFPIMYQWRIFSNDPDELNLEYWGDIESYTQYWENDLTIRKRIEDLNKSSAHIALFLEYVPKNLNEWLCSKITQGEEAAEAAIVFVEESLKNISIWMNSHDFVHFDAHFENILTDGNCLFVSDFGLALSSKFELSKAEVDFLKQHNNYDQAFTTLNLLRLITTSYFRNDQWATLLREYIEGEHGTLTPISSIIKQYAKISLVLDDFFQKLQNTSKSTVYPAIQLEKLIK